MNAIGSALSEGVSVGRCVVLEVVLFDEGRLVGLYGYSPLITLEVVELEAGVTTGSAGRYTFAGSVFCSKSEHPQRNTHNIAKNTAQNFLLISFTPAEHIVSYIIIAISCGIVK